METASLNSESNSFSQNTRIIDLSNDFRLKNDATFGPALDGGYYLIGLNKLQEFIFDNKPWSASDLLDVTLKELKRNNISYTLLESLNDIDTFEDLIASEFYKSNKELQKKITQLHD